MPSGHFATKQLVNVASTDIEVEGIINTAVMSCVVE